MYELYGVLLINWCIANYSSSELAHYETLWINQFLNSFRCPSYWCRRFNGCDHIDPHHLWMVLVCLLLSTHMLRTASHKGMHHLYSFYENLCCFSIFQQFQRSFLLNRQDLQSPGLFLLQQNLWKIVKCSDVRALIVV